MTTATSSTSSHDAVIVVSKSDLPLCCPRPGDEVWNMHPRVYLPLEKTGHAKCIYCGAEYVLDTSSDDD